MTLDDEPEVRSGAPGHGRAAGGLEPRRVDRRDDRPGAAPGRRAAGRAALPITCCPSSLPPRRRDRRGPARSLRGDERASATRDPRAHGQRSPPIPPPAGSSWCCASSGIAAWRNPRRALDWMARVLLRARLARREPAAPARPGQPAARGPCATPCRSAEGTGSTIPPNAWQPATPARLALGGPPSSPRRTTPLCACAGSCSTRRPATARRSPPSSRGSATGHLDRTAPEGAARRRQGARSRTHSPTRSARSPARRCATSSCGSPRCPTRAWAPTSYLANALRVDLAGRPPQALAKLNSLRKRPAPRRRRAHVPRLVREMRGAIAPKLESFAARLDPKAALAPHLARLGVAVAARLRHARHDGVPVHVGLHAPNKQGGVIITSVPAVHFADRPTGEAARLPRLPPLRRRGIARRLFQDRRRRSGLQQRDAQLGLVGAGRLLRRAHAQAAQTVRFVIGMIKDARSTPPSATT